MAKNLRKALQESLKQLSAVAIEELLETRFARLMAYGRVREQTAR